jgi:hypothetical protein
MAKMKEHKYLVIRWLGERSRPERFGVVEMDERGPILRSGPLTATAAQLEADRLTREAPPMETRRGK